MTVEGRWTIFLDTDLNELVVEGPSVGREDVVPVVPCDEDAVNRAAVEVEDAMRGFYGDIFDGIGAVERDAFLRAVATAALRGAGEKPS